MWKSERQQAVRTRQDHPHIERIDPSDRRFRQERDRCELGFVRVLRFRPLGFLGIVEQRTCTAHRHLGESGEVRCPGDGEGHGRRSAGPEGLTQARPRTVDGIGTHRPGHLGEHADR